jgi:hypothetical protein
MVALAAIRSSAPSAKSRSSTVRGAHWRTVVGFPAWSTATMMMMQWVELSNSPVFASADETSTRTWMLDLPVWITRASTSTSSPGLIGRVKCTLPTYAVTHDRPDHPTAQAYPALSIHSKTLPA